MQILVHICCAPCFTYPCQQLLKAGHDVTGFFYNPNIHPFQEYMKRLESLKKYSGIKGIEVLYNYDYDLESYLGNALRASDRCNFCYTSRLMETAKTASSLGFDAFTTTLLISPYQKHEFLNKAGKKAADENNIDFYYEDFRQGYRESRKLAGTFQLYMQKYCGCIFSEKERYYKMKNLK